MDAVTRRGHHRVSLERQGQLDEESCVDLSWHVFADEGGLATVPAAESLADEGEAGTCSTVC